MPRGGVCGNSGSHFRFPYQRVRFLCPMAIYIIWSYRRYVEFRYPFYAMQLCCCYFSEVCNISRHSFPICKPCTYALLSSCVRTGLGFGLLNMPPYVMIAHYFDRRLSLAIGLGSMGSGLGTLIFNPMSKVRE
ncbi:hypothetical protein DPMN_136724 [Dreissena polymorpha]|uniref:Uncharacterized protein n=1 Tax=Dreissena polymorpha TaxID=45954 RepID=A0A9D4JCX8_DREPO|nr:hypothetical protein DPMN_136724 [Dreissena polymorpha]